MTFPEKRHRSHALSSYIYAYTYTYLYIGFFSYLFFSLFYAVNRIKRFSRRSCGETGSLALRSCFQPERDKKEPATHMPHRRH